MYNSVPPPQTEPNCLAQNTEDVVQCWAWRYVPPMIRLVLAPRDLGTTDSAVALSKLKEFPDASTQSSPHQPC